MKLYHADDFAREQIELCFIQTECGEYAQFKNDFIPSLSIIDVLMFNSKEEVREMLKSFRLIKGGVRDAV